MNLPQGYKQTELGIIPEDWEVTTIGSISQNRSYGVGAEAVSYSGGPKYIRITDIDDQTRQYLPSPLSSPAFYNENHIVKENDVLFARTGASVGKSYVYNIKDGMLIFAGFLMRFNIHNASAKFVFYNTLSKRYNDWVMSESARTGQPGLNITQLSSYTIPLPPLSEQKAIAEALSDVDELITALNKKIAKKRLIKQGAMQELLTGKKRLPGFEEEWVEKSLSQLGSFISGNAFPICFQGSKSGKYPFFKVSDFNNNGNESCLMNSNNYISELTKEKLNCNIVPANSIIFAKIGAAIFLERKRLSAKECCIDNNMMAFASNEYIDANYLCFLLQTISFGEFVESTALPSLGTKILGGIILKIPKMPNEQQAIATILSDMDKEIADLEVQREKYRLVKSGMMQKLLTGEIRLKKE